MTKISFLLALATTFSVCGLTQVANADNLLERAAERYQFSEWAKNHPDWVQSHQERFQYFLHHPEEAERSRSEWAEAPASNRAFTPTTAPVSENNEFSAWAHQHPEWVQGHHDRYQYFLAHPNEANKARGEWAEFHGSPIVSSSTPSEFETWSQQHPRWVERHRERYEYFRTHPSEANASRHEWAELHGDEEAPREWHH